MKYAASFIGWSNTGKTTIIGSLISALKKRGYRVSALKKSHVAPHLDTASKDTDRLFHEGADKVGFFSSDEGFLRFHRPPGEMDIGHYFYDCDILLCEGFRLPDFPLIEVVGPDFKSRGCKADPNEVSAYILTDPAGGSFKPSLNTPVFPGEEPGPIIDYLEELWTRR